MLKCCHFNYVASIFEFDFFLFAFLVSLSAFRSSYGGHHLAYECIDSHHRSCERNIADMAAKIIGIKLVIEHTDPSVLIFSFTKLEGGKLF